MQLSERLQILSSIAEDFIPFTGEFGERTLSQWIEQDLGHIGHLIDEEAETKNPLQSFATPLSPALVVVSSNTPHAAIQSLLRALILGSKTHFKLPSGGLPEFIELVQKLPSDLQKSISYSEELPDNWREHFEALVVYGSDETITWFAQRVPPEMRFLKHGQRLAIGLVTGEPEIAAALAAKDICLYDQQGCQSLHDLYLSPDIGCSPSTFCELLANEMEVFTKKNPRPPLSLSESGTINNLRETVRYLAANHPTKHLLLESERGTDWTVIYEDTPEIKLSCLNRVAYVKPWPDNLADLGPETKHLSVIALHPWPEEIPAGLLSLAPPRVCPLGSCQFPPLSWHHDGHSSLGSLVKWTDLA